MSKENIEEPIKALRSEIEKRFNEVREKLDRALDSSKKIVEERPLVAVGIAFAFGIFMGVLLGRKSKD